MRIPRAVIVVVAILVIAALGWDYYQVRQEARCAHAAVVRGGSHE